jgi:hypothetical protein
MTVYAKFHGNGGYPCEVELAKETLEIGSEYVVENAEVSRFHTNLLIDGKRYNSCMFDVLGDLDSISEDQYINPNVQPDLPCAKR